MAGPVTSGKWVAISPDGRSTSRTRRKIARRRGSASAVRTAPSSTPLSKQTLLKASTMEAIGWSRRQTCQRRQHDRRQVTATRVMTLVTVAGRNGGTHSAPTWVPWGPHVPEHHNLGISLPVVSRHRRSAAGRHGGRRRYRRQWRGHPRLFHVAEHARSGGGRCLPDRASEAGNPPAPVPSWPRSPSGWRTSGAPNRVRSSGQSCLSWPPDSLRTAPVRTPGRVTLGSCSCRDSSSAGLSLTTPRTTTPGPSMAGTF